MSSIVESKVCCPKCKSDTLVLTEIWNGSSIEWEQVDGKFNRKFGNLNPGDPVSVEAHCNKCDHRWKIRGAIQIDDVVKSQKVE